MTISKPDVVLVQLPPHYILDNFEQHPIRFSENQWSFDNHNYLRQLERPGHELYPSLKSKLNMDKLLKSNNMIVSRKSKLEIDVN